MNISELHVKTSTQNVLRKECKSTIKNNQVQLNKKPRSKFQSAQSLRKKCARNKSQLIENHLFIIFQRFFKQSEQYGTIINQIYLIINDKGRPHIRYPQLPR